MTATATWYEQNQQVSLKTADAHYEPWTVEDLDMVSAFTDEVSDLELAVTLGRTLHAVQDVQWRMRRGEMGGMRERAVRRATPVKEPKGWTFIGDDVPPGWND